MRTTYEVPAEGIVDLREAAAERVQLRARLAALLELALEAAEDVVERERVLSRRTGGPATHAADAGHLLSGTGPAEECVGIIRALGGLLVLLMLLVGVSAVEGGRGRLVLLGPGSRCCVLGREDADDAGGDFVVHDRLVVFAHNVDTELDNVIRLQFKGF